MTDLVNGQIQKEMSNEAYHANVSHVSSSGLKLFLDDPRAFYIKYVEKKKDTAPHPNQDAFDFGSYIHAHILEPWLVDEEFAVFSGAIRRGEAWKKFKKENEGKIILTMNQGATADKMLEGFVNQKVLIGKHGYAEERQLSSFFEKGKAEESFAINLDGLDVKVRCDYRKDFEEFGSVNDVKTTNESLYPDKDKHNLKVVEDVCKRFSYDLSAALYVDVISIILGKPQDFYFTFLSKSTGHSCIFRASDAMLERGRAKYKEAIKGIKEARETGIWFTNSIQEIG